MHSLFFGLALCLGATVPSRAQQAISDQTIVFVLQNSEDIRIEGVTIRNAPLHDEHWHSQTLDIIDGGNWPKWVKKIGVKPFVPQPR